jgi:spermidine synthase
MKPWVELARARADGGGMLSLHRRGDEVVIKVDGELLMSNRQHGSEDELARLGCGGGLAGGAPRVLIGGLGLGYTLRAALAVVGAGARVVVAEIAAPLVEWNRTLLDDEFAAPLADPRVTVAVGDVGAQLADAATFDAILYDVDNSPHALTRPANAALYGPAGLSRAKRALRPGGRLAVWSAVPDAGFERRLAQAGFRASAHMARSRPGAGSKHTIFVGVVS